MAVYQISKLRIKPGRLDDFLAHQDDIKAINQRHGLASRRLLRASLAGEDVGTVMVVSEFENMAAFAAWNEGRSQDPEYREWRKTTPNANPDAAAELLSTSLMTDITRY